jgi:hypothetical protein
MIKKIPKIIKNTPDNRPFEFKKICSSELLKRDRIRPKKIKMDEKRIIFIFKFVPKNNFEKML